MTKKNTLLILLSFFVAYIFCVLPVQGISAKRSGPPVVVDVVYNGVRYTPSLADKGYVEARDSLTNRLLWKKLVYEIKYDPNRESDVQDIFITKLAIENDSLSVTDERGKVYYINLSHNNDAPPTKNILAVIVVTVIGVVGVTIFNRGKKSERQS